MTPPDLPADAALFLDFDGCLVEISDRPDSITVPEALPARLARLHQRLDGAVALISGRDIADLRRYLPDFPGAIAGSHGAEVSLDGRRIEAVHGVDLDVAALHRAARDLAAPHPAVLVEVKPHGVSLHYRADPALRGFVEDMMARLAEAHPGMALQPSKMAVELRPEGSSKDGALARLMGLDGFAGRVPVYAGDDLTDEAAIAEAQARGGFGIKIGEGETVARYRLPGTEALAGWLDRALAG
ncbi:trehalose-phosphatase [Paracoccus spongiarum]|uniref:Trehalose 6-phosphate phosphatase n=1 Tax=Paracoccus spongiarum TaxID=3064387 RepID=A0ABT9JBD2_9RHOB|nr:trehalose-phosphatase [Paracoccus sp. 2205BS29-5]MDP5306930.1 trehalose-phosphatase [Paracoccus sp. 2205BS29-5]